jgi:hypothetical protein
MYWQLICKTCKRSAPFCATSKEELEYPHASCEPCPCCGSYDHVSSSQQRAVEATEQFYATHAGHELEVMDSDLAKVILGWK